MKKIFLSYLLVSAFSCLNAQENTKMLKGTTVTIHFFYCNRPQMISVDNQGDTLIVDLHSSSFNGSKKYFDGVIENNKILSKTFDAYFKAGYEMESSMPNSDKCSNTYILHKRQKL